MCLKSGYEAVEIQFVSQALYYTKTLFRFKVNSVFAFLIENLEIGIFCSEIVKGLVVYISLFSKVVWSYV